VPSESFTVTELEFTRLDEVVVATSNERYYNLENWFANVSSRLQITKMQISSHLTLS